MSEKKQNVGIIKNISQVLYFYLIYLQLEIKNRFEFYSP